MLYTVNRSPLSASSLQSVLRIAPAGSPILLYEDAVYAVLPGASSEPLVRAAVASHTVYALDADLKARGITRVMDRIQVIDYDGFVKLVEQHNVAPWL